MITPINEHNMLTLDFWRDTVTYEGKTIPVGAMACWTLNIPGTVILWNGIRAAVVKRAFGDFVRFSVLRSHIRNRSKKQEGMCRND